MNPEEFDLRVKLGQRATALKLNQESVKMHMDLGFQSVGVHLLNPYIKLGLPKLGESTKDQKSSTLGAVFHFNHDHPYSKRFFSQFELGFDPSETGSKLSLRKKVRVDWSGTKLELFNQIEASKTTRITSTASILSPRFYGLQGFFQANFLNFSRYTGFDLGVSYQYSRWAQAYFWTSNPDFESAGPATTVGLAYYPGESLSALGALRVALLPTGGLGVQAESSQLFGWLRIAAAVDLRRDSDRLDVSPRLLVQGRFE